MADAPAYAVPDLTQASTYTNPAMLPDMGVQQTQLDQLFSQNPVSMPVNDVIAAIQSQYQPVPVNYGDGPYGAARFIGQNSGVTDAYQPVNIGTIPSWFTPGQFDINAFSSTPDQALANEIATGEFYGGSSPVEQVGTSEFANDPYANWGQSVPKGLSALVNMMIPGAGLALNAAQGYANTTLGNAINTGLSAYGGVPAGPSSPFAGALLGTIGVQTESGKMAQALGKQFSDQQSLYGYMSVATDPQMQSIAEALMANASTPLSANDVGVIGAAIGSQISSNIASGMSVGEAYAAAAQSLGGFTPGDAAALGASASQNAVQSAINSGSDISSLNPADVNAYNDPIGGLISNLGLSGSSTESSSGESYGGVDNTGAAMSASDADVAYGADQYGGYETQSSGDSGGGGSSKIVCTAMNEAYGFGSFRNRIWLKYAQDNLTKAHEVGYHTLFLPLVDLGYKKDVKPVRKALEHIARHRSADLRAEMRGAKRDNLGRMYRFVLEPLCYVVGKLKGY